MKSHDNSIMRTPPLRQGRGRRLLTLIIGIFLAVTLLGCHDPNEVNIAAEHRKLTEVAKQHLSAFPLNSQTETFYPAP